MGLTNRLKVLHLLLKYLITLILLAISIVISKDVFDQYASKSTSYKQYEEVLTDNESVTLVIGFWPLKKMKYPDSTPYQSFEQWELDKDFELSFGISNYRTIQEMNNWHNNDDADLIISHSSIGKVEINEFVTVYGTYYKISANIIKVKTPYWAFVNVRFRNHILDDEIPSNDILMTSESNSYGMTMDDWVDGKRLKISKVKGFYWVSVQPKKMKKLKKCSDSTSFYECFGSELKEQK